MEGSLGNSFPSQPVLGRLRRSMMPQHLQDKRIQLAQEKVKAKHRRRATPVFPLRMTSCIFPRPVTRITSHAKNIIKCRKMLEEMVEKPRPLCAFRRLHQYLVEDSKGKIQAEAKVQSGLSSLHTSPHFPSIPPLSSEKMAQGTVELCPSSFSQEVTSSVALQLLPSLSSRVVTTRDIQRQAQKVNRARKRLAALLEADRLARQAETMA
ncbi:putative methyl-CpG-binding domain protein 3-like 3 [Cricetulus griseus]|uniref:Methyl-CpG-binding domain protein 3-like 3 n=1 Tax=Cricetulus griseus TaxID=10029 RepID=A0A9J7JTE6_CRIGR|nr:putative methyl-CpG-binding domain protein 3-like 3 [Cricetulus griseus]